MVLKLFRTASKIAPMRYPVSKNPNAIRSKLKLLRIPLAPRMKNDPRLQKIPTEATTTKKTPMGNYVGQYAAKQLMYVYIAASYDYNARDKKVPSGLTTTPAALSK